MCQTTAAEVGPAKANGGFKFTDYPSVFLGPHSYFPGVGLLLGPRARDSGIPRETLRGTFSHGDPRGVSDTQSSRILVALFSLSQVSFSDDGGTRSKLLQNILLSSCELKSFGYVDLYFH